ncbi:FAR1-related sequence 5-like protein [Tanacetum coccineum]
MRTKDRITKYSIQQPIPTSTNDFNIKPTPYNSVTNRNISPIFWEFSDNNNGSGNGWMRYEDDGESLENVVESGSGGDGGLKGCLVPWTLFGGVTDTKSYTWLLKAFMTAFLKEPTMIVTDQDGAMKRAIEAVFTKAKHRLCMWHIMQKIPSKIPAYFNDSPLFGLTRTTSRSESENPFFQSFTSPGAMLVSFMMSYESAMERQRYRQEALDFKTIDAAPKCDTKLAIERHAAKVYTRTIFLLVQTEIIEGCWSCTVQDLIINEGCETVIIRDKKPNDNRALYTKKGKEQEKKTGTVANTVRDYKKTSDLLE